MDMSETIYWECVKTEDEIIELVPKIEKIRNKFSEKIRWLESVYNITDVKADYYGISFDWAGAHYAYNVLDGFKIELDDIETDCEAEDVPSIVVDIAELFIMFLKGTVNTFTKMIETETSYVYLWDREKDIYETGKYSWEKKIVGVVPVFIFSAGRTIIAEVPWDVKTKEDLKVTWGNV
jgi:hypothetical protein